LFIVLRFDFWVPCQQLVLVLDSSPAAQAAVFFTDFCFCLSALAQQGFVFPIFSLFLIHRTARRTIPCRFFASHRAAVLVS
jgi:hypothetical protein